MINIKENKELNKSLFISYMNEGSTEIKQTRKYYKQAQDIALVKDEILTYSKLLQAIKSQCKHKNIDLSISIIKKQNYYIVLKETATLTRKPVFCEDKFQLIKHLTGILDTLQLI